MVSLDEPQNGVPAPADSPRVMVGLPRPEPSGRRTSPPPTSRARHVGSPRPRTIRNGRTSPPPTSRARHGRLPSPTNHQERAYQPTADFPRASWSAPLAHEPSGTGVPAHRRCIFQTLFCLIFFI
ncbi:hypothetical protein JTE90_017006 [Oedothorax gibbosus]|uniref:Uncharacterized protein n=1 Tax=Oedothorax gibbosus TaxID=931172 RepID=A0AAV6UD49_9ARAC|nr:hypothetical protein JTE90_017006 [Oedothorax gibbosus]